MDRRAALRRFPAPKLAARGAGPRRRLCLLTAVSLALAPLSVPRLAAEEAPTREAEWSIQADYTDTCSCDLACPCFFGSSPTHDHCEGVTLVEIRHGHYGGTRLDGVKVLAVYRGGEWMKFYVDDGADEAQTKAAVQLLPAFEDFFVSDNVLEVENVPMSVERGAGRLKVSTPNTTAEIEVLKGKNGQPIRIENLPAPGFPTLPMYDHTQYRSILLKHEAEDERFEYSGTTGFIAKVEASFPSSE